MLNQSSNYYQEKEEYSKFIYYSNAKKNYNFNKKQKPKASGKENKITSKNYYYTTRKENSSQNEPYSFNNLIPLNLSKYIKESNNSSKKSNFNKQKKSFNPFSFNIGTKEFYKDGKSEEFNLFKEKEIGLNGWDKKINILESEEDYDSDQSIINDGKGKAKDDLNEAFKLFKKNRFKDIFNYKLYCKYNKKNLK